VQLEHFRAQWLPVRVKKMRQNKDLKRFLIPRDLKVLLARAMIELYYWTTPNGHKITLFLEEAGLPYTIHPVNLGRGDQFKPEFLAISPNNRIPAIVDQDPGDGGAPVSVFESGAILLYLVEKTGKFLPRDCGPDRKARMALLAGRRPWPDGRPEPSFQTIRA
jgi:Glutathione S-transferase, N-terminal domain